MSGAPWRRHPFERTEEDGSDIAAQIGRTISDVVEASLLFTNLFVSNIEEEKQDQNSAKPTTTTTKNYGMFHHHAMPTSELTTLETLNNILPKIKVQRNKTFERHRILNVIRDIAKGLRDMSPLFKEIYLDILWTGRFYEGLKTCDADEYDLNIILALPIKYSDLTVTIRGASTGYVCINNFGQALRVIRTNQNQLYNIYRKMEEWCDANGALKQDKVKYWLKNLLDIYISKNKEKILRNFGLLNISLTEWGSTWTVMIKVAGKKDINIDLVPAIEFKSVAGRYNISPPSTFRKLPYIMSWYSVPKPKDHANNVWRLSFCLHEKALMKVVGNLKPAISLIKELRDTQQWHPIHNYFIKTVALWEIHDIQNRHLISFMSLDKVFFHLLENLHERLQSNTLVSYWDPQHNLLEAVSEHLKKTEIANRMRQVIDTLKRDPTMIEKHILP